MIISPKPDFEEKDAAKLVPTEHALIAWKESLARNGVKSGGFSLDDLPLVSIGFPEVWPLLEIVDQEKLSTLLRSKLTNRDYYLMRFPCSFRPQYKELAIEQAVFGIHFYSERTSDQPILVEELHPMRVDYEIKHKARFALSPSLKFFDVEACPGECLLELEYPELIPTICADGIGEAYPRWEYRETLGQTIMGSKEMFVLFRTPKGTSSLTANCAITAHLRAYGSLLKVVAGLEKNAKDRASFKTFKLLPIK